MSGQVFWQTDRQTTEEHTNIGTLRSRSWKFEVNPFRDISRERLIIKLAGA